MSEMKMPSAEELAEVVYKYCQTNKISHIREDELVKKITDYEMKNTNILQPQNDDLDKKVEDSSDFDIDNMVNFLMFTFKLSKRFYDIIDILIDECKANREKRDGEKFYYLTFYLTPLEVDSIKLVKSSIEILTNDLYNFCKTNNIDGLKKDDVKKVIDVNDDELIDKVIDMLEKKGMIRLYKVENQWVLVFYLTDSKIQMNKNLKLMIKNAAELLLDDCNQNEITYIEKEELQKIMKYEDNSDLFDELLDYLKERHLVDIDYNSEDGKYYITVYC